MAKAAVPSIVTQIVLRMQVFGRVDCTMWRSGGMQICDTFGSIELHPKYYSTPSLPD